MYNNGRTRIIIMLYNGGGSIRRVQYWLITEIIIVCNVIRIIIIIINIKASITRIISLQLHNDTSLQFNRRHYHYYYRNTIKNIIMFTVFFIHIYLFEKF